MPINRRDGMIFILPDIRDGAVTDHPAKPRIVKTPFPFVALRAKLMLS